VVGCDVEAGTSKAAAEPPQSIVGRLGLFVGEGAGGVDGDAAVDEQGLAGDVAGGFAG